MMPLWLLRQQQLHLSGSSARQRPESSFGRCSRRRLTLHASVSRRAARPRSSAASRWERRLQTSWNLWTAAMYCALLCACSYLELVCSAAPAHAASPVALRPRARTRAAGSGPVSSQQAPAAVFLNGEWPTTAELGLLQPASCQFCYHRCVQHLSFCCKDDAAGKCRAP